VSRAGTYAASPASACLASQRIGQRSPRCLQRGHEREQHTVWWARSHGYPLAILWSFLARDRHTIWSAAVERDIDAFTHEA
jgi:hypothetical protein